MLRTPDPGLSALDYIIDHQSVSHGVKRLLHSASDGRAVASLRRRRADVVARSTNRLNTRPNSAISRLTTSSVPSSSVVAGSSRVCRRRIWRTMPTSNSSTLWSSSADISTNLHWRFVATRTPSVQCIPAHTPISQSIVLYFRHTENREKIEKTQKELF